MNKLYKNRVLRSVLLAVAIAGSTGAQEPRGKTTGDKPGPLANGVYAVLREGHTREEVQMEKVPCIILVYDRKYPATDKNEPPRYVALETSSFVPLILAGPPETHKDDRGWTLLNVTLAREHVKTLEEFTRTHLDGTVATVIDGEIITMHKVRTVIQDGKAQITRCTDNACETLRLKLAN